MILRLALRSLATRPVRTAVLACGFGFGIAVMAALLGVGDVILEQAHSPALEGGGDVVLSGRFGALENARFLIANVIGGPDLAPQAIAVSPWRRGTLYLLQGGRTTAVAVTGGLPDAERAVADREIESVASWRDTPADRAWSSPDGAAVLKAMDRFHPIPNTPEFSASWAEWLYFNGRTADGRVRFYLTFMVGPRTAPGRRAAGVRLQLDREGKTTTYAAGEIVDEDEVLGSAPDLDIAGSHVRLEGSRYRIDLALPGASGTLLLDAAAGQSLPPATITGARGWVTGYTAPVLSGTVHGDLTVGRDVIALRDAIGYHDHNWGFWKGVRWQWGQVASGDLSFVYGRIFPPSDVADSDRIPGFLGVLGQKGPVGFSTTVTLEEAADKRGQPQRVTIHARGQAIDLKMEFAVDRVVRTPMAMTSSAPGMPADFLQMGGEYRVTGTVGARAVDFTARGAAETFR
ncbi:MAG: hypothetical protein JWL71_882 [Acidobacteria bacterium]|nr:hypothetical protein [Acidobacteriota bacterium]